MIPDFPIYVISFSKIARLGGMSTDPPKDLYYRGNIDLISKERHILCVVGARNHTSYGREITVEMISSLKGRDIVVLSGLAIGIDSIALETALDVGLPVIGMPGSGLGSDTLYPRASVSLSKRILESGGLLLSPYPENETAKKWMFPKRNELMSLLSDVVLITECSILSGTMSTAHHALSTYKEVLTIPGSIFSPLSEGPNHLIYSGAEIVCNGADLSYTLDSIFAHNSNFV